MMKIVGKVLQKIFSVYVILVFLLLMIIVFPFVIIASFWGRIKGGNAIWKLCSWWADCWFFLVFIYHKKIYEAPHDRSKQYIFVSNHISYLDSAVLVQAFRQPVRPLGKVEITKVPVFGYIYKRAIVSVDRTSPEQRAKSIRILRSIIGKGISVLVFPEGTFNTTHQPLKDFYDGAFRLAIETQTPIKPVLFLDTYSRMHYSSVFSFTPGRNRIVYLPEISVAGMTPNDKDKLKEKVYKEMEERLIAYQAAWINKNKQNTTNEIVSNKHE